MNPHPKLILVSRCSWTLYNFRTGLMRAAKQQGYTVLGGGSGGDGYEHKIEDIGIPFHRLPVSFKPINPLADLYLLWSLYHWYRRERPEIVHHFTIKPVIYGTIAARIAGVPKIANTITGLGYAFMGERLTWLQWIVERLYKISLAGAHFTFFQNEDDLNYFLQRRLVLPDQTDLLPGSGVDTDYYSPEQGNNDKRTMRSVTFLMMARLLRDKGVYEFSEAARLVKAKYPGTAFHILGSRDERNPTVVPQKDLDRWQSEGVVTLLGETEDVRPYLGRADIFVLPSYREGTPRSLLEAAAMGRPIITTDAVGCREVVDHEETGLFVPIKDAEALAQAMIRMIENPEMRERMGKAGRKKIEREFDERIVIDKIMKVYDARAG
ncbi:MAG: glycosyltransferase family 4 protein [Chloroflexota bacterium]|nr:MAG: glycosyltransferase family 4 protein [Chloroflexota bacterium]